MKNKTIRSIIALAVVLLLTGGAAALVFNTVPAIKMHLAGTTLEESVVEVTDIMPNGNKKVNSVDVRLDNTDGAVHVVNIYVSIYDTTDTEIGTGTAIGFSVAPGTVTENIPMTLKPDFKDVFSINVVIKEIA